MEQRRSDKGFYTVPFVWNKTLWVMTFVVFGVWIVPSMWMLYEICTLPNATEQLVGLILLNVIMLPMILICEGLAPQRLEIAADEIRILRRYKSVTITRSEIKSIEQLPEVAMRAAIRTCGVGGCFGYFGYYYTPVIGSFKLYATSFKSLYLIKMWNGKQVVVSCAEPEIMEQFIER